jgi:hypothetical protein
MPRICAIVSVAAACFSVAPATASASTPPEFLNVTEATDTDDFSFGRGSAMVDLNYDGLLDIITGNALGPNLVFRQLPDHSFVLANNEWGFGIDDDLTWGTIVSDFDDDGDPDVLFVNGTAGGFSYTDPCRLYRNDLRTTGAFTDVTGLSGDLAIPSENFGGTSFDYDNDGDLDIFLTSKIDESPCRLLRNDGKLEFTDVGVEAGITHLSTFRHCSTGDYNNDGWMDIGVGSLSDANRLYRNNGDGTFTDVAQTLGLSSQRYNFGLVLEDFNNDGWQDVYIPKWQVSPVGPSEIFLNNGDGTFADITSGSGLTGQTDMGHNTGDIDLDGYPDIFVGTGAPEFASPDLLLLMTPDQFGGVVANDVSDASGITGLGGTRCHGIVMGDYDRDGDIDIYLNNGGPPFYRDTKQGNTLLQNQADPTPWAAITLEGVLSNRDGVGARCVAFTDTGREIHRIHRSAHGFCNTNPAEVWFGIGSDTSIQRIEIEWPSGLTQTIKSPAMMQITHVVEPACKADTNSDGMLSPTDFSAWINAFNEKSRKCDQNGDYFCTSTDFSAWIAGFNSGC